MGKYTTSCPSAPSARSLSVALRAFLARLALVGALGASAALGYTALSAAAPSVHTVPAHVVTADNTPSTGPCSGAPLPC